jgi:Flp pilus assembly protein TadB
VSRGGRSANGRRRKRPKRPIDEGIAVPRRPYRDSVIFYAVLATLIVVVALLTNGNVVRSVLVAAGFFVVATAWSWWRFRTRLQRDAQQR